MRQFLILGMITFSLCVCAQVGIGTASPNTNSVLELNSPNKGLLLPRVTDTTVVSSPSAGLVVYNTNTKSPSYHDGQKWNSVASSMIMPTTGSDSITYRFTGTNSMGDFDGERRLESINVSGSGTGSSTDLSASMTRYHDINSIVILKRFLDQAQIGTLEIKYYKNGTVYRSMKFGNLKFASMNNGFLDKGLDGSGVGLESFIFTFGSYGYKDWVSNQSFYYTFSGGIYGTY